MKKIILYFFLSLPFIGFTQVARRGVEVVDSSVATEGTTYAVVIGISKYKDVTPLRFADRDATIFADFLRSKKGMGLDSLNVRLFLNENATLNNIGNALSDIIIKNLKKGDKIIFFFAGHGDYDAHILRDQALLLLYGAPKQNYFQNIFSGDFISTADLNARFIEPLSTKGCEVTLIIDACHATGMNKTLSGGTEGGKITMMALQNMTSPVKIYSCQANQYSLESEQWGGGRGLFSYVLMEGLYGLADTNGDKKVSLRELQRYLEDKVPGMAAPNKQDPIIKIEDAGETVVKVNDELLTAYNAEKNKSFPFMAKAGTKGSNDFGETMDTLQKKLYAACDSLIESRQLQDAYTTFIAFSKKDSTSDASLQLRRNLSAALQEKSADILSPMFRDVSKFNSSRVGVEEAMTDLKKAAALLGESHFLYKNLEARILFLKVIFMLINDESGNTAEAIEDLSQSAALEPNAPYTYYYLGYFYNKAKDLQKAKNNYEKYLALIPNSSWAYSSLGLVYEDLKNYDKAIFNYKKSIEFDPTDAQPYSCLGILYEYLNRYSEATDVYNQAILTIPATSTNFLCLANIYKGLKKYDTAIYYYKKEIEWYPYSSLGYLNIGIVYRLTNKYDEAIKNYLKTIELDSTDAFTYNNLANVYFDQKKYADAIIFYKKAIAIKPDYTVAYKNLGLLYDQLEKYDSAIFEYREALKTDPQFSSSFYNLGTAYKSKLMYDSSLLNFNKYVELIPQDKLGYFYIGYVYAKLKNYGECTKYYKKAIEIDSTFSNAWFNLGSNYDINLENYEEAAKCYVKAISLDTTYASAYFNLGLIHKNAGKYTEALDEFRNAVKYDPTDAFAYNQLGTVLQQLGKYDEALFNYKKSVAIDSTYFRAWLSLGNDYYLLDKTDSSTLAYKRVIQLDSTYYYAYYFIGTNYEKQLKYNDALVYYKKTVALNREQSVFFKSIGNLYYTNIKNYDSSWFYYNAAYNLQNDDVDVIERMAYSLLRTGKPNDAIDMFKKQVKINPNDPWGYYDIACVYSLQNNTSEALDYFKQALDKKMNELNHWETDTDINNLRTLPEFKALLQKYFSAEDLAKRPKMFEPAVKK